MAQIDRRTIMGLGALVAVGVAGFAGRDLIFPPAPAPLNLTDENVILKGHDPVAYFTDGTAVRGTARHQTSHGGAVYHFASAENLSLFLESPEKYAPAYGGYCAYGVRMGMKFDIDPKAFEIVGGKLYVQLDPGTRSVWLEDRDGNINIANSEWPRIRMTAPETLTATHAERDEP